MWGLLAENSTQSVYKTTNPPNAANENQLSCCRFPLQLSGRRYFSGSYRHTICSAESTRLVPVWGIWNSASIPSSGDTFWLTDQLILLVPIPVTPPPSLSSSCTMRTTLQRPRPASSSRALRPQPRLLHPARTRARPRPARRLPQRRQRHRVQGLRGRLRLLRLLTPPSTWEQPLQHLVCIKGISFDHPRDYFAFCLRLIVPLEMCIFLAATLFFQSVVAYFLI